MYLKKAGEYIGWNVMNENQNDDNNLKWVNNVNSS